MKLILRLLRNHRCYWGIPCKSPTGSGLIQTCYECSRTRVVRVSNIGNGAA